METIQTESYTKCGAIIIHLCTVLEYTIWNNKVEYNNAQFEWIKKLKVK